MNEKLLCFEAPVSIKANVIRMGLAFLGSSWAIIFIFYHVFSEIKSGRIYEELRWFWAILVLLGMMSGLHVIIKVWVSFWTDSISVKIGSKFITGKNMWNSFKTMQLDEIVIIRKSKINKSILLIDRDGKKFVVSGSVNNFGDCIEEITAHAINVKEIDYEGLDKDPMIWKKNL